MIVGECWKLRLQRDPLWLRRSSHSDYCPRLWALGFQPPRVESSCFHQGHFYTDPLWTKLSFLTTPLYYPTSFMLRVEVSLLRARSWNTPLAGLIYVYDKLPGDLCHRLEISLMQPRTFHTLIKELQNPPCLDPPKEPTPTVGVGSLMHPF